MENKKAIIIKEKIKKILFDNVTVKQTIFKNTFWLGINLAMGMLSGLVLSVFAARNLGATEYGKFNFALSFASLFFVFFTFGINQIIIRDFAKDENKEKDFSAILSLKIVLGIITLMFIGIGSFLVTKDSAIHRMILILGLFAFFESFYNTIYAFFQARQRMEYHALTQILGSLVLTGFGLFVLFKFPLAQNLARAYLASGVIVAVCVLLILHYKVQYIKIIWDINVWKKFLKLSWPLALVAFCYQIYNNIDSVMMGYFGQITQTGWYNAAFRITSIVLVPMSLITTSFFPVLSKVSEKHSQKFQRLWDVQMELIIMIVLPLVIGGIVLAPKIISFLYGPAYFPSILAFQILIVSAGIIFLYDGSFKKPLIIFNHQKKIFFALFSGALINIVLNLFLIPKYSLYGAAVATLIAQIFIFLLELMFILKYTEIDIFNLKFFKAFSGAIISGILMYFVISLPFVYSFNVILVVIVGAMTYFACFLSYKGLLQRILAYGTR